ncbi:Uncharacterised domain, di-copper centre [Lasallia pustulata]|uniref:tyrosinase n=1 Tax=Lasallia pustulata TaxID=136370 RepID=A0A1W5D0E8_9LECA|nr:Uncharacterised domain, di-copper centre [Lasallia pustulata]
MSGGPIETHGIPVASGPGGPVPIRREIRDLEENFPDQWNLYLLGLDAFMHVDENEPLSYYQVAGIHGRPYSPWSGVEGVQASGYCTHNSILFPTWHRPYLALFEEVLYTLIQKIAGDFPKSEGRDRYLAAARDFRMPYWDWAIVTGQGQGVLPLSVQSPQVEVISATSGGKRVPMDNPLYSFHFDPLNPTEGDFPDDSQFSGWESTVRWPRNGTATSQNNLAEQALQSEVRNLRERVFYILSSYLRYGPFSNNAWNKGRPGIYGSLEGVHDTIHNKTGGEGHMGNVAYAAFDPIFWLHHTNIDRFFAMWQAIHPNSYVEPQITAGGAYTTRAGSSETEATDLTPFYEDPNSFWDSDGVKATETFGYAYPETQSWNFDSINDYQASVSAAINRLYRGGSLATIMRDSSSGSLSRAAQMKKQPEAQPQDSPAQVAEASNIKTSATAQQPEDASTQAGETPSVKAFSGRKTRVAATSTNGHQGSTDQKPMEDAGTDRQLPQHSMPKESASSGSGPHESKPEESKSHESTSHESKPQESKEDDSKPQTTPDIKSLAPDGKYLEWITNIRALKHGLGGTFSVHILLGDFQRDNPSSWPFDPNHVGTFTVLGDSADTGCDKCRRDQHSNLQVTGQIPLTIALAERYLAHHLDDLTPNSVVPYLQKNLHWRVTLADGTEVALAEVPELTVSVISNEVQLPTAPHQLPTYAEEVEVYPAITTNRDGAGRGENTGLTSEEQT